MIELDAKSFLESLKMWDRPETSAKASKRPKIIQLDDNIDQIIDEMFERYFDLRADRCHRFSTNC